MDKHLNKFKLSAYFAGAALVGISSGDWRVAVGMLGVAVMLWGIFYG